MALSRKLTTMNENISCDPMYLAKVAYFKLQDEQVVIPLMIHNLPAYFQVGRERQRFDFDDYDPVPQRFNI